MSRRHIGAIRAIPRDHCRKFSGAVVDPHIHDFAAEAAEHAGARALFDAPVLADYERAELKKMLKLDDEQLNELVSLGFPGGRLVHQARSNDPSGRRMSSVERWNRRAVDQWLERIVRLTRGVRRS